MKGRLIIFTILLAGILTIVFLAVRGRQQPAPSTPTASSPPATPAPQKPKVVLPDRGISPVLSFGGDAVWYLTSQGRMYRLSLTAGGEKIEYALPSLLPDAARVIWQRNGSNFIVEQNVSGHTRYQYYDATSKVFIPYSQLLREPAFVAGDKKIVYDWAEPSGRHQLTVADNTSLNYHRVIDLSRADYRIVASPQRNEAALFTDNSADPADLLVVDLGTGTIKVITKKTALEGLSFSPDGTRLLASERQAGGAAPRLAVYDLGSGRRTDLGATGEVESAAWQFDGSSVLVAVNEGLAQYGLTGEKPTAVFTQKDFRGRGLFISSKDRSVFYLDPVSGQLYQLGF